MAYVKINFNSSAAKTIDYVLREMSPSEPCTFEGVDKDSAVEQFLAVQRRSKGKSRNQAIHIIQSWDEANSSKLSPSEFNKIGVTMAQKFAKGHDFLVATHTNTKHMHNHIVINPVSSIDYKRIHNKKEHLHTLRLMSNELCKQNGLEVPWNNSRGNFEKLPDVVKQIRRREGFSWILDLRDKADFARGYSQNFDEYIGILGELGVGVKVSKKNITYFYSMKQTNRIRGDKLDKYFSDGKEKYGVNGVGRFLELNKARSMERGDRLNAIRRSMESRDSIPLDLSCKSPGKKILEHWFGGNAERGDRRTFMRDRRPHYPSDNDLRNSIVPISEIRRARTGSIVDYCKRKGIDLSTNANGRLSIRGREHIELQNEFQLINTKNKVHGTLIEFVALHEKCSYLKAISKINNNKALLRLENEFGEVKRNFNSFYIPNKEQLLKKDALKSLGKFLSQHGVREKNSLKLLSGNRFQVGQSGIIRLFGDDRDSAIEFEHDGKKWNRKNLGNHVGPFLEIHGTSKNALIYTDPLQLFKNEESSIVDGKASKDTLISLSAVDERQVDVLLGKRSHIKKLSLIEPPGEPNKEWFDLLKLLEGKVKTKGMEISKTKDRGKYLGPTI